MVQGPLLLASVHSALAQTSHPPAQAVSERCSLTVPVGERNQILRTLIVAMQGVSSPLMLH